MKIEYSEKTLEHFYYPRNVGKLNDGDPSVLMGLAGGLQSGEIVRLQFYLKKDVVSQAKFKAQGSVGTIAAMSWLTEWLINKPLEAIETLTAAFISTELALPRDKMYCAQLAEQALNDALTKRRYQ